MVVSCLSYPIYYIYIYQTAMLKEFNLCNMKLCNILSASHRFYFQCVSTLGRPVISLCL